MVVELGQHIHHLLEHEVEYPVEDLKLALWDYAALATGAGDGSKLKKRYKRAKKEKT